MLLSVRSSPLQSAHLADFLISLDFPLQSLKCHASQFQAGAEIFCQKFAFLADLKISGQGSNLGDIQQTLAQLLHLQSLHLVWFNIYDFKNGAFPSVSSLTLDLCDIHTNASFESVFPELRELKFVQPTVHGDIKILSLLRDSDLQSLLLTECKIHNFDGISLPSVTSVTLAECAVHMEVHIKTVFPKLRKLLLVDVEATNDKKVLYDNLLQSDTLEHLRIETLDQEAARVISFKEHLEHLKSLDIAFPLSAGSDILYGAKLIQCLRMNQSRDRTFPPKHFTWSWFPSISHLDMDKMPSTFLQLPSTIKLTLRNFTMALSRPYLYLGHLRQLELQNVICNDVHDRHLETFMGYLSSLEELHIGNDQPLYQQFRKLPASVTQLTLHHVVFYHPKAILSAPKLIKLMIIDCFMSGYSKAGKHASMIPLKALSSLHDLHIRNRSLHMLFQSRLHPSLQFFSNLPPSLTCLTLGAVILTIPGAILTAGNLTELTVTGCRNDNEDFSISDLSSLKHLKRINVDGVLPPLHHR